MENLTLEELDLLQNWYSWMDCYSPGKAGKDDKLLLEKIKQAIADKEFEEKTRPLNF